MPKRNGSSTLRVHHLVPCGRSGGGGTAFSCQLSAFSLQALLGPDRVFHKIEPPAAGGLSSFSGTIYLSGGEIEALRRNKKSHSSSSGEMAHSRGRIPPLVQASAPRAVRDPEDLSHLRKTLNPGVPGLPFQHLSTLQGSGLCVARTPRLPRIHSVEPPNSGDPTLMFSVSCEGKYVNRKSLKKCQIAEPRAARSWTLAVRCEAARQAKPQNARRHRARAARGER